MPLRKVLQDLLRVVLEEVDRNPEFGQRLEAVLKLSEAAGQPVSSSTRWEYSDVKRGNRRTPAVLDPIDLARQGEETLRQRLVELSLEQLKDVVADYGMDPGKLVMKWRAADRIVDRIVEVSLARARKGEAFMAPEAEGDGSQP